MLSRVVPNKISSISHPHIPLHSYAHTFQIAALLSHRCTFNHAFNGERGADHQLPTGAYLATQEGVQDSTWRVDGVNNPSLPCPADNSGNNPNGYVYSKYLWSLYHSENPFYGHFGSVLPNFVGVNNGAGYSSADIPAGNPFGIGVFTTHLSGTTDATSCATFGGGPLHQDLAVHHDALIAVYNHRNHYGSLGESISQPFERLFGPWLTFFVTNANASDTSGLLGSADATAQAEIATSIPALPWMNDTRYAPAALRANVTGTIALQAGDTRPADKLWVLFSIAACNSVDSAYMIDAPTYYVRTNAVGNFTLIGLPPATYNLFIWPRGGQMVGMQCFPRALIVNGSTQVGPVALGVITYAPALHSTFLWSVGITDGQGLEFNFGNHTREWTLPQIVPGSLNYVIGSSWEGANWYYAQTTGGTWSVSFMLARAYAGTATLTVCASMIDWEQPAVAVNGVTSALVGSIVDHADSTLNRQAVRSGRPYTTLITFPASLLRVGANAITFSRGCCPRGNNTGLGYDAVLLEVDEPVAPLPAAITISFLSGGVAMPGGPSTWTLSIMNSGSGEARQVVLEAAALALPSNAPPQLSFPAGQNPHVAPLPVIESLKAGGVFSWSLQLACNALPCNASSAAGGAALSVTISANGRRTIASTSVPWSCGSMSMTPSASPTAVSISATPTTTLSASRTVSASLSSSATGTQLYSFSSTPSSSSSPGTAIGATSTLVVRLGDSSRQYDGSSGTSLPTYVDEYAYSPTQRSFSLLSSTPLPCAADGADDYWGALSASATSTEAAVSVVCWAVVPGTSLAPPPRNASALVASVNIQRAVSTFEFPLDSLPDSGTLVAASRSGGAVAGSQLGAAVYATGAGAGILGVTVTAGAASAAVFGDLTEGAVYRDLSPYAPAGLTTDQLAVSVADGTQVFVGAGPPMFSPPASPLYVAHTGNANSDVRSSAFDSYAAPTRLVQADAGWGVRLYATASNAAMFAQLEGSPAAPPDSVNGSVVRSASIARLNGETYVIASTGTSLWALNWATGEWEAGMLAAQGTVFRGVAHPPRLTSWAPPTPSMTFSSTPSSAPIFPVPTPTPSRVSPVGGGFPFTYGAVTAVRIGDASGSAADTFFRPVYLDEYAVDVNTGISMGILQSIPLPCVNVPASLGMAGLAGSADGLSVMTPCFSTSAGTSGTLTSSSSFPRVLVQALPDGSLGSAVIPIASVYYIGGAGVAAFTASTVYAIVTGGSTNGNGLRLIQGPGNIVNASATTVYSAWRYSGTNAGYVTSLSPFSGSLYLSLSQASAPTGILVARDLTSSTWASYLDVLNPTETTPLWTGALASARGIVFNSSSLAYATDVSTGVWRLTMDPLTGAWLQGGPYAPIAAGGPNESAFAGAALATGGAMLFVAGSHGIYALATANMLWVSGGSPIITPSTGGVYRGIALSPAMPPTPMPTATRSHSPNLSGSSSTTNSQSLTPAASVSATDTPVSTSPAGTASPTAMSSSSSSVSLSPSHILTAMATSTQSGAPTPTVVTTGAPFVIGSLTALRVGDSSGAATDSVFRAVYLDEFMMASPSGALVLRQSIRLPTAPTNVGTGTISCVNVPSSPSMAGITRAADGASLLFPCFNTSVGTAGSLSSSTFSRVIGQVLPNGVVTYFAIGLNNVYYVPGSGTAGLTSAAVYAAVVGGSTTGDGLVYLSPGAGTPVGSALGLSFTNNIATGAWRHSGISAGVIGAIAAYGGNLYFSTTGFTSASGYPVTGIVVVPAIVGKAWAQYIDILNLQYPNEVVYLNTTALASPRGIVVYNYSAIWASDSDIGVFLFTNTSGSTGLWSVAIGPLMPLAATIINSIALAADGWSLYVVAAQGVYGFSTESNTWLGDGSPLVTPPVGSVYRGISLSPALSQPATNVSSTATPGSTTTPSVTGPSASSSTSAQATMSFTHSGAVTGSPSALPSSTMTATHLTPSSSSAGSWQ